MSCSRCHSGRIDPRNAELCTPCAIEVWDRVSKEEARCELERVPDWVKEDRCDDAYRRAVACPVEVLSPGCLN